MAALLCIVVFSLAPFLSHTADPDPLLDFFIADLNASPSFANFPCKPTKNVTSEDFFFDGLMKEGNTSNLFGVAVSPGNVLTFPSLNTLGLSMNRVDLAPNGLNPSHTHPQATGSGVVLNGKVLVGFVTTGNVFYLLLQSVASGAEVCDLQGVGSFSDECGRKEGSNYNSLQWPESRGSDFTHKSIWLTTFNS